jgi:hypothetical protein
MKRKQPEKWRLQFRKNFMKGFCEDDNCNGCGDDKRNLENIEEFIARLLKAN